MRWKLALTVPALLMVANATIATAQVQDSIPVTMTMEAKEVPPPDPPAVNNPVDSVKFFFPGDTELGEAVPKPQDGRTQVVVGYLPWANETYSLKAWVYIGKSVHMNELRFNHQDTCTESEDDHLERIACSLVKHGHDLVCTAVYRGMDDPEQSCGSHACITCNRIQLCGADPECP